MGRERWTRKLDEERRGKEGKHMTVQGKGNEDRGEWRRKCDWRTGLETWEWKRRKKKGE